MSDENPPPQSPPNTKIQQLKDEWEQLAQEVEKMKEHTDSTLSIYTKQLEQIGEQKMKQLQEWKENEIKCAHKFQEGQIYAIDCDYNQRKIDIETKVKGLTIFKAKILQQEFPEALKYFTEQGYDFSFLNMSNEPEQKENAFVDIEESNEKLLTNEEVQEDLEAIKTIDDWKPHDLEIGKNVKIETPGIPPLIGTVCSIMDKTFEIKQSNGTIIQISYLAVGSGISKLTIE